MTKQQTQQFLIVATIVLVVGMVLVALFSSSPTTGLRDAAAALTIIAAVSVGIERVLEGFWTYIGLTRNSWWPLNIVSQDINTMASNLDQVLEPFYQQLTKAVEDAKNAGQWSQQQLDAANKEITDFQNFIAQLKQLTPGSQQATAIANIISQQISNFQQRYKTLDAVATSTNQAINSFTNFIVTPPDNLGRRFISLFLGMYLGLVVAGVLGLDLLQAIFTTSLAFHLGVVLTGLVMGLGSSPTHEVIQVLQNWKTNLKTQDTVTPSGS
jgi:hypothetical protein